MAEEENTGQQHDINEKLLLDLAWERQQKKVRVSCPCFSATCSIFAHTILLFEGQDNLFFY